MIKAWHWCVFVLLLVALGCGGGGGSTAGPTEVNVVGQILWVETGSGTDPVSTVRIGDVSAQTDITDGFFSMDVPSGSTTLTVTYAGSTPIVRTFTFPALTNDTDLGELYIGPESVTVSGTVIDSTSSNPVANATVKIGGRTATTTANGQFSVLDVAYSGDSLAVFLGLQGTINATNYFQGFFNPTSAASGGIVNVGTISLTPEGSTTPPGLPYNLSGSILPTGSGGGATVQAKQGAAVIRTAPADVTGRYTMWLPAGTYTIEATNSGLTGSTPVTITDVSQQTSLNVTIN